MLTDPSRRLFLFGAAAAVAAASVPAMVLAPRRLLSPIVCLSRDILEVTIELASANATEFTLDIGGHRMLQYGVGNGGLFHWCAPYREHLVLPAHLTAELGLSRGAVASISLISKTHFKTFDPITVVERYKFPRADDDPPAIHPLDARDTEWIQRIVCSGGSFPPSLS